MFNTKLAFFKKSIKRRGKEIRRMRVMTCLAVFFLSFTLLLQDNIGAYRMELNYREYGHWFAYATDGFFKKYDYLEDGGSVYVGSNIYLTHPRVSVYDGSFENDLVPIKTENENGSVTVIQPDITDEDGNFLPPEEHIEVDELGGRRVINGFIGAFSEGFADKNGITLYDGRLPQADNEIAMELSVLHELGYSYEIGQDVTFYVSPKVPLLPKSNSYENGIPVHDEEDYYLPLTLVTFRLVGTVRRYTQNWSEGANLPSAIVTAQAFESLDSYKREISFYDLKEGTGGENVWEFSSQEFSKYEQKQEDWLFSQDDTKQNSELEELHAWNSAAYGSPLWGSGKLYNYITLLLIFMSICIIAYLMASYLRKRKPFFIKMREIGAPVYEVWGLAAYECVVSTLPFALISLAAAYAFALLCAFVLTKAMGLPFVFHFVPATLLKIVLAIIMILAVSLIIALILFAGKGIAEKKKKMSKSARRAVSHRAKRKRSTAYLGLSETLKRERLIHPVKTWLTRIVCIALCALILFCFMQLFESAYYYYKLVNSGSDFSGTYHRNGFNADVSCVADTEAHWSDNSYIRTKIDTEELILAKNMNFWASTEVLGKEFLDDAMKVPGIKKLTYGMYDNTHPISWEGKENDKFIAYCIDEGLHSGDMNQYFKLRFDGDHLEDMRRCMDNSYYRLACFEDTKALWSLAKPYLDRSVADYDSFVKGEQVIMVVDTNAFNVLTMNYTWREYTMESFVKETENKWEELGHSFDPGDTVTIQSNNEEGVDTSAVVAGIIPADEYSKLAYGGPGDISGSVFKPMNEGEYGVMMALGSINFAEQVQKNDGGEFGMNVFGVKFDSPAEAKNNTKALTALCIRYGVQFSETIEYYDELEGDYIDTILTYGFFGFMLLILLIFVFQSIAKEERAAIEQRVTAFQNSGVPVSKLKLQKSADSAKQSLWVIAAIPFYILMMAVSRIKEAGAEGDIKSYLANIKNTSWNLIKYHIGHLGIAVICAVVVMMVIMWLLNRKLINKNKEGIN